MRWYTESLLYDNSSVTPCVITAPPPSSSSSQSNSPSVVGAPGAPASGLVPLQALSMDLPPSRALYWATMDATTLLLDELFFAQASKPGKLLVSFPMPIFPTAGVTCSPDAIHVHVMTASGLLYRLDLVVPASS